MAEIRAMTLVLVLLFTEWQANYGIAHEDVKVDAVSIERELVNGGVAVEAINNDIKVESERKGAVARTSKISNDEVVGKFGYQSEKQAVIAAGKKRVEDTNEAAFVAFNTDYHPATHHPPRHN